MTMTLVNGELKYAPKTKISLGNTFVRSMAKKPTGKVSMSDLYGKAAKVLRERTFTSSTNWVAPLSTEVVLTLKGKGGVGYRGYTYTVGYTLVETTTTKKFTEPPPSIYMYVISSHEQRTPATANSYVPGTSGYSWYTSSPDGLTVEQSQPLYRYTQTSYYKEEETERVPSHYGGDASAFGYTYAGTYGETPVTGSATNVKVVPGRSYPIVVPSGGFVTITYEEDMA
jgi:hypothetical protein